MPAIQKKILIDDIYPSRQDTRKDVLSTLIKIISESGVSLTVTIDELFLCLDEAVTNAMEHGNRWNSAKSVRIIVELDKAALIVRVSDEGDGFDVLSFRESMQSRDKLSIRGRGLFIIGQYCHISWNQKGNELILKFDIEI
jgi:anti-sigma regulatory factor (Ser/Thr protein kinase)